MRFLEKKNLFFKQDGELLDFEVKADKLTDIEKDAKKYYPQSEKTYLFVEGENQPFAGYGESKIMEGKNYIFTNVVSLEEYTFIDDKNNFSFTLSLCPSTNASVLSTNIANILRRIDKNLHTVFLLIPNSSSVVSRKSISEYVPNENENEKEKVFKIQRNYENVQIPLFQLPSLPKEDYEIVECNQPTPPIDHNFNGYAFNIDTFRNYRNYIMDNPGIFDEFFEWMQNNHSEDAKILKENQRKIEQFLKIEPYSYSKILLNNSQSRIIGVKDERLKSFLRLLSDETLFSNNQIKMDDFIRLHQEKPDLDMADLFSLFALYDDISKIRKAVSSL